MGRLIVVKDRDQARARVECQCDCGAFTSILIANWGRILSCGCLQRERVSELNSTHGMSGTTEYVVWIGMWDRCTNPNNHAWKNYGGRGITVCERWTDFVSFYEDVGVRPGSEYSLDRIDNDGNYEPTNIRWATASQQALNKRRPTPRLICRKGLHVYTEQDMKTNGFHRCGECNREWTRAYRIKTGRKKGPA